MAFCLKIFGYVGYLTDEIVITNSHLISTFYRVPFLGKDVINMLRVMNFDWLTRFMKVTYLGSHWSEHVVSTDIKRLDYSINVQQYN